MLKLILAGLIVAVVMGGAAVAGPLEDADDAERHGDYATAVSRYRPLAEQGNADAQTSLGDLYAAGAGVVQDYAEAMKWLRKAAEQGDPRGQYFLGGMYEDGTGVPRNPALAYMWFNLAVARETNVVIRDYWSQARDRVAKLLTPDQLAEAQRLAREWKPKTQP